MLEMMSQRCMFDNIVKHKNITRMTHFLCIGDIQIEGLDINHPFRTIEGRNDLNTTDAYLIVP